MFTKQQLLQVFLESLCRWVLLNRNEGGVFDDRRRCHLIGRSCSEHRKSTKDAACCNHCTAFLPTTVYRLTPGFLTWRTRPRRGTFGSFPVTRTMLTFHEIFQQFWFFWSRQSFELGRVLELRMEYGTPSEKGL